jgi:hypothetical protein
MPEIVLQGTSQIQVAVLAGPSVPVSVSPGIGASVVVNGTATSIFGTAGINPFVGGANITITTTGGGITIIGRNPPVETVQGRAGNVVLSLADITAAAAIHTHSTSQITSFTTAASLAAPVQSVAGRTGAVSLTTTDISAFTTAARTASPVQSVAGRTGAVSLTTTDISAFTTAARTAAPVQSVAGRTGAISLTTTDISLFTTAARTAAPVQSVAGRTGAVSLATTDISAFTAAVNAAMKVVSVQGRTGVVSLQAQDIPNAVQSKAEGNQYAIPRIVRMSQSDYASLANKDPNAVYVVASSATTSAEARIFLGATVPGAPVMSDACSTHPDGPGHEFTSVTFYPPANTGNSPILGYDLWVDNTPYMEWVQGETQGFYPNVPASLVPNSGGQWRLEIPEDVTGLDVSIRAYNAIGFGALSNDVVGQYC